VENSPHSFIPLWHISCLHHAHHFSHLEPRKTEPCHALITYPVHRGSKPEAAKTPCPSAPRLPQTMKLKLKPPYPHLRLSPVIMKIKGTLGNLYLEHHPHPTLRKLRPRTRARSRGPVHYAKAVPEVLPFYQLPWAFGIGK